MDFSTYEAIAFSRDGRILTVTLNRPETLNAADPVLQEELARVFDDCAQDPGSDVVVLTGAGRAFSAGGDLQWMRSRTFDERAFAMEARSARTTVFSILDCPKPIIAKVNGDAIGLGATLALMCDFVIASETARFADPHVRVGLAAGDGGAVIWPQLIGFSRAKAYLLLGDTLDAAEAARIGLITLAVPSDALDEVTARYAARLAAGAQQAIRYTKIAVNLQLKQIMANVFDAGIAYEGLTMASRDHKEAVSAFIEKRKPVFGQA